MTDLGEISDPLLAREKVGMVGGGLGRRYDEDG